MPRKQTPTQTPRDRHAEYRRINASLSDVSSSQLIGQLYKRHEVVLLRTLVVVEFVAIVALSWATNN